MNLRRQLLLVSLLTLMLPWAGCEFIRETEVALRDGQQQMLAGTARAVANSLAQYSEEFPERDPAFPVDDQLYIDELAQAPAIDGYVDDWSTHALHSMRGADGPVRFTLGRFGDAVFLYAEVTDRNVVYATPQSIIPGGSSRHADRVVLASSNPPYLQEAISFAAEAPGPILSYKQTAYGFAPEPTISAYWQDFAGGYRVETRIPASQLGTHLGVTVINTSDPQLAGTQTASFLGRFPAPSRQLVPDLMPVAEAFVQPDMRLLVTDADGWRIAQAGELGSAASDDRASRFVRRIYGLLLEEGDEATLAEPDPLGREQQPYVSAALEGRETGAWFRSTETGRAVVAVAAPVVSGDRVVGSVIMQQGTDAILSLTNEGLKRLIYVTLVTTIVVAGALLGYASWLSRRIRNLSVAAETALETEDLARALPSALARDEIGDLSRSFSWVLQQLGEYNDYLRTLASKLSHELRTPLAIVTSSLENLEHESLDETALGYTARAREGADRLRAILNAMSEASRVEELMKNADPERFDLRSVLESAAAAYRDAYAERRFEFTAAAGDTIVTGSPELLIQMLDKLIDNAVDFSGAGDTIRIELSGNEESLSIDVMNPGPPLPERMRSQLFDSMVSMRAGKDSRHLGLGLYIARLIAEGHGGSIRAENSDGGVVFSVSLPRPA
jgi:two-component system sensor histidine kinase ChvG